MMRWTRGCACVVLVTSVVWYGYMATVMVFNRSFPFLSISNNSSMATGSVNDPRAVMAKVALFGGRFKPDAQVVKPQRVLFNLNNCQDACVGQAENRSCKGEKLKQIFECNHMMVLAHKNMGRTGNQMFQVAALLGIASFHGYTPIIDPSVSITALFDLPNLSKIKLDHISHLREKSCCIYEPKASNLSHAYNWTLNGYFQSWRYFQGAEHIIRKSFKLKDKYKNDAYDFINHSAEQKACKIGVHVRRGDFSGSSAQNRGYTMAPLSFIKNALQYFRNKYTSVHFFIISDDKGWCERELSGKDVTIAPRTSAVGFDMAVLVLCDHVIVTSGSFGWWGGWLAGGEVVYWKGFPGNNTWLGQQTKREDYYPNDWIGLP